MSQQECGQLMRADVDQASQYEGIEDSIYKGLLLLCLTLCIACCSFRIVVIVILVV